MPSKVMRRSGNAVTQYLTAINFESKQVFLAGVGGHHEEVAVMRETWPEMELYGWEPNAETYKGLLDAFPGMLQNAALWSSRKELILYARDNWKDGTSVFEPKPGDSHGWKKHAVRAVTLDESVHVFEDSRNGLLWLDCEGSELEALRGGTELVDRNIGVINIELTCRPRQQGWPTPNEVHAWLDAHQFYQAWTHTIRPSIGQFDAIYVHRSLYDVEYNCCLDAARRIQYLKSEELSKP
jgi:FkbM family methyltransferase